VRHELRYRGQSFELAVDEELELGALDPDALREAFADAHEQRYGYRDEHCEVELVNMRVSVWGAAPALELRAAGARPTPAQTRPVVFDGAPVAASVLRGALAPGTRVRGPALCALPEATLLVAPGWSGEVDERGTVRLAATT